uniref:Secreted protein n=1 Tax=Syphacia muris TaxID=451379 RepID=A0A0N5ATG9_9BILA
MLIELLYISASIVTVVCWGWSSVAESCRCSFADIPFGSSAGIKLLPLVDSCLVIQCSELVHSQLFATVVPLCPLCTHVNITACTLQYTLVAVAVVELILCQILE